MRPLCFCLDPPHPSTDPALVTGARDPPPPKNLHHFSRQARSGDLKEAFGSPVPSTLALPRAPPEKRWHLRILKGGASTSLSFPDVTASFPPLNLDPHIEHPLIHLLDKVASRKDPHACAQRPAASSDTPRTTPQSSAPQPLLGTNSANFKGVMRSRRWIPRSTAAPPAPWERAVAAQTTADEAQGEDHRFTRKDLPHLVSRNMGGGRPGAPLPRITEPPAYGREV